MKNRIYILITLAMMLFSTTSCDDFLDITPDGQVERDDLLSTQEGVEDALYGVYSQLRNSSLYGQELSFKSIEIMAQTLYCNDNNTHGMDALSQYDYEHSQNLAIFENVWTVMYNNISNVNSILNSENISSGSALYNIYKGEALGLRAFMHFDLMRLFCEQFTQNKEASGIPYATEFSLNTPDFETLAKNYEHVIADLLEAEILLANEQAVVSEYSERTNFLKDRQIHFNLYAVQATLARVYLTMGEKTKAYEYAKKVIDGSGRSLTEKTKVYGDLAGVLSRTETIFGVYYADFYSLVNPLLQQTTTYSSLDLRYDIEDIYMQELGTGQDFRTSAYFTSIAMGDNQKLRFSKITDSYALNNMTSSRPTDLILGINMIRLPEMYYICAETLLETDIDKATEYFNAVLTHRGLNELDKPLTQELINLERYKELIGEGQIFFNMKRQNLSISGYDRIKVYSPSNDIYVVPIPESEFENRF